MTLKEILLSIGYVVLHYRSPKKKPDERRLSLPESAPNFFSIHPFPVILRRGSYRWGISQPVTAPIAVRHCGSRSPSLRYSLHEAWLERQTK